MLRIRQLVRYLTLNFLLYDLHILVWAHPQNLPTQILGFGRDFDHLRSSRENDFRQKKEPQGISFFFLLGAKEASVFAICLALNPLLHLLWLAVMVFRLP